MLLRLTFVAFAAWAGCGDDSTPPQHDAAVDAPHADAPRVDAAVDAPTHDAAHDGSPHD
jgi:hypothetical protein